MTNTKTLDAGQSYELGWYDAMRYQPMNRDIIGLFVSAYECGYRDAERRRV